MKKIIIFIFSLLILSANAVDYVDWYVPVRFWNNLQVYYPIFCYNEASPPIVVDYPELCPNLNADYLDGYDSSNFEPALGSPPSNPANYWLRGDKTWQLQGTGGGLNADKVDGYDLNQSVTTTAKPTFAGLTLTGTLATNSRVAFGNGGALNTSQIMNVWHNFSTLTSTLYGIYLYCQASNIISNSSASMFGFRSIVDPIIRANNVTCSGIIRGFQGEVNGGIIGSNLTGNFSSLIAVDSVVMQRVDTGCVSNVTDVYLVRAHNWHHYAGSGANGTANITNLYKFFASSQPSVQNLNITNHYGLYIDDITQGQNRYGIKIDDVSSGTLNYAIKTGAGLVSFGDNLQIEKTQWKDWNVLSKVGAIINCSYSTRGVMLTGVTSRLYLPIDYEQGTKITKIRLRYKGNDYDSVIYMQVLKRAETSTNANDTTILFGNGYYVTPAITLTTIDVNDFTIEAGYSYSILIMTDELYEPIEFLGYGIETEKRSL